MTDKPPFNAGLPKPSKNQLRHGIYLWVKDRIEGYIGFSYLDSLSYDDMMLFARAMGYTGPGSDPVPVPAVAHRYITIAERTTVREEVTSEGGEEDGTSA